MDLIDTDRYQIANIAERFGLVLRAHRRAGQLTQGDLADVIGVNRRVIGDLERGKPTVQLEIALGAARALGLDVELHPRR